MARVTPHQLGNTDRTRPHWSCKLRSSIALMADVSTPHLPITLTREESVLCYLLRCNAPFCYCMQGFALSKATGDPHGRLEPASGVGLQAAWVWPVVLWSLVALRVDIDAIDSNAVLMINNGVVCIIALNLLENPTKGKNAFKMHNIGGVRSPN